MKDRKEPIEDQGSRAEPGSRRRYEKPAIAEEESFTTLAFACAATDYPGYEQFCGTYVPASG